MVRKSASFLLLLVLGWVAGVRGAESGGGADHLSFLQLDVDVFPGLHDPGAFSAAGNALHPDDNPREKQCGDDGQQDPCHNSPMYNKTKMISMKTKAYRM